MKKLQEKEKRISLVGYDFSDRVSAEQIKDWKKELQKDFDGEIAGRLPEDGAGAVFVTDRVKRCGEAKEKGVPHLFYLHEDSRGETLDGIPYAVTTLRGVGLNELDRVYRRFFRLPWMILETKRCILRELVEDDLDELYRIYDDPSITRYTEGLYEDREKERAYLKDYTEQVYRFCGYGIWAVIQKESGRLIGRAGLACREGFDTPELGYVIEKDCQRKGYATEVCRAILDYAVSELDFPVIRVLFQKENEASLRLCRKLGFLEDRETEIDGTLMQQYIYTVGRAQSGRAWEKTAKQR